MEFKQLESYVAVVEQRSFTKAAEALYVSQPTVSTHVRMLEEELGSGLITRTTKSIEITAEGMKAYRYACDLLTMRNRMLQECAADTKQIIHVGASTIPSAYILPELLPRFSRQAPNTFFVIRQGNSQTVADSVLDGVYDVGLIGMPAEKEGLVCTPFCEDRMVVITPVNEQFLALQSGAALPLDVLLRQPIILREKGSGSQKRADTFLQRIGVDEASLTVCARVNEPEAIKNLVAGGLGISIISERAALSFLREKRLLSFPLAPDDGTRNLYVIHRDTQSTRRDVQEFIRFVLTAYPMPPDA